jgi:drug/metabolite transporter (DMT)-like permease
LLSTKSLDRAVLKASAVDVGAAPQTTARPRAVYLWLAVIVLSWSLNWPLMKLALADAPPFSFVLLRLVGTLGLLVPAMLAVRAPLWPVAGERLMLFWVGQLQVAAFLICAIIGLSILPAGRAIVLAYTMPLWAIPIELVAEPQRLRPLQVGGAVVGLAGLLLFMNPSEVDWTSTRALGGNAMLLAAAICWAGGSILYRRRRWQSGFWAQTFWQLLVSVPVVAAVALPAMLGGPPVHWTPALVAILVYNWIVTTALGYFLWNKVLSVLSAGIAGQVVALTPVGGFLLSTAIFGGAVTGDVVVSVVLIVGGIMLTLRG